MTSSITKTSGTITFINGDEVKFNFLTEMVGIIKNHTSSTPEFITVYGLSSEGKTYQLGLDFNMLSESAIDPEKMRFTRHEKFLGEILIDKGYLTKEKLNKILLLQQKSQYNERVGELLIRESMVTQEQIYTALIEQAPKKP